MDDDEKSLHKSVAKGDVETLKNLLKKDPSLLTQVSYTSPPTKIPLHVATIQGHHEIVKEILSQNDAKILAGQLDSQQSSALHIASARGDLVIVKLLLAASPDLCFLRDCQGRNPLHLAVLKGNDKVLEVLVKVAPNAAREKVDRGVNLLHLCVKHRQLGCLKVLVPVLNDMINDADDDGDILLHLAVRDIELDKQDETLKYLVETTEADVNVENSKGETALDILKPKGPYADASRHVIELRTFQKTQPEKWLTRKRDSIMVVAILIATMAFQAGVTPPGGVWQDDKRDDLHYPHKAGEAVIASIHPKAYRVFLRCNTVALVSSLSTILLLISGLPFKRRLFMWFLMVIMWLTVTSIAATYGISIHVVTPEKYYEPLFHVMRIAVGVWSGVLAILLIGNTIRLFHSTLRNKRIKLQRKKITDSVRGKWTSTSTGLGRV